MCIFYFTADWGDEGQLYCQHNRLVRFRSPCTFFTTLKNRLRVHVNFHVQAKTHSAWLRLCSDLATGWTTEV